MPAITRDQAIQICGSEKRLQELIEYGEKGGHSEIARLKGGMAKLYYQDGQSEFFLSDDDRNSIQEALERGEVGLLCT